MQYAVQIQVTVQTPWAITFLLLLWDENVDFSEKISNYNDHLGIDKMSSLFFFRDFRLCDTFLGGEGFALCCHYFSFTANILKEEWVEFC